MALKYIISPMGVIKLLTCFTGIAILVIGTHSHVESAWYSAYSSLGNTSYWGMYQDCNKYLDKGKNTEVHCPNINQDRIYIIIIAICPGASIICYILNVGFSSRIENLDMMDAFYHVVGGVALVSGGVLYWITANQIVYMVKTLHIKVEVPLPSGNGTFTPDLLHDEKIIISYVTMAQGSLFVFIMCFMACKGIHDNPLPKKQKLPNI